MLLRNSSAFNKNIMIKTIKRIFLSCLSILGISFLIWIVFLLNPSFSYAKKTEFDVVTVYHNQVLEEETELVIKNAMTIIKQSAIYDESLKIQFCLNDDEIYPNLFPFAGATAYAFFDKTVMYASSPNFKENYTEFRWEINNNELRKYNLTNLLAHEFMHNLQHNYDSNYYVTSTLGNINWILEGHAEYTARSFKNDGRLKAKVAIYLSEENKDHSGVPVIILEDNTIQNLSYYKYALIIQYLMEEKNLEFNQICELEMGLDVLYKELIEWSRI